MTVRTYPLHEIVRLTGLTARSIRYYIERDMLPGPEQRGVATVYTHEQLVRLKAIPLLRKRERLRLAGVKRRLDKLSLAEIEALVTPPAPPRPVPPPGEEPTTYPRTRWDHVELIPGLELRVRADAGAIVRRLAQEIFARYAVSAPPGGVVASAPGVVALPGAASAVAVSAAVSDAAALPRPVAGGAGNG